MRPSVLAPPPVLVLSLLLALVAAPATADVPAPSRDAVWPLAPRPDVVAGFDPPATRWGAGHRGVDLAGRPGQAVHASLAGTITFSAPLAGRGVVVVDHGAFRTTYEPVDALVAVGDHVARGQVVGTLRGRRSHCPPRACLHWGMRAGDAYLDPLTLVGAGPVRLLPLSGTTASAAGSAPVAPLALAPLVAPLVVAPVARLPTHAGRRAV